MTEILSLESRQVVDLKNHLVQIQEAWAKAGKPKGTGEYGIIMECVQEVKKDILVAQEAERRRSLAIQIIPTN